MADYRWSKVSSLWIGGQLSWLENLCLSSFAARGYQVNLYSYEEIEVPEGVTLVDARKVIAEAEVFRNPPPSTSYAGFSNVFRYELLGQQPDEVWIDTDVIATDKPLPSSEYLLGFETKAFVNGAILRLPRESALLTMLRKEAMLVDKKSFVWGDLGPKLITEQVDRLGMWESVAPSREFYEIRATEAWKFFSASHASEIATRLSGSSAVHIWNEALRLSPQSPKGFSPNPKSFIGMLGVELGIETPRVAMSKATLNLWRFNSNVQARKNFIAGVLSKALP